MGYLPQTSSHFFPGGNVQPTQQNWYPNQGYQPSDQAAPVQDVQQPPNPALPPRQENLVPPVHQQQSVQQDVNPAPESRTGLPEGDVHPPRGAQPAAEQQDPNAGTRNELDLEIPPPTPARGDASSSESGGVSDDDRSPSVRSRRSSSRASVDRRYTASRGARDRVASIRGGRNEGVSTRQGRSDFPANEERQPPPNQDANFEQNRPGFYFPDGRGGPGAFNFRNLRGRGPRGVRNPDPRGGSLHRNFPEDRRDLHDRNSFERPPAPDIRPDGRGNIVDAVYQRRVPARPSDGLPYPLQAQQPFHQQQQWNNPPHSYPQPPQQQQLPSAQPDVRNPSSGRAPVVDNQVRPPERTSTTNPGHTQAHFNPPDQTFGPPPMVIQSRGANPSQQRPDFQAGCLVNDCDPHPPQAQ